MKTITDTTSIIKKSFKTSILVAVLSGLSGILMLLLDIAIASHFGIDKTVDAYQLAISFPSLTINILAGGTLVAVLVPFLVKLRLEDKTQDALALISNTKSMLIKLLALACILWVLIFTQFIHYFTNNSTDSHLTLSIKIALITTPILFFCGLASINGAILNSQNKFKFTATMPAYMPAFGLVFIYGLASEIHVYSAAFGILIGSFVQWLVSNNLVQNKYVNKPQIKLDKKIISDFKSNFYITALSATLITGIYWTDTLMASSLSEGDIAIYSFATKPVMLILAFITTIIGNVLLPTLSELASNKNWGGLKKYAITWFVIVLILSISLLMLWKSLALEFVSLIYQHGSFSHNDSIKVAGIQEVYVLQIPFFLVAMVGMRVLNSTKNNHILCLISGICFLSNFMLDNYLKLNMGLKGIAWGTNISFILWAILTLSYVAYTYRVNSR